MLADKERFLLIFKAGQKTPEITDVVEGDMVSGKVLAAERTDDGEVNSDLKLFKNCIFLKMILYVQL